MKPFHRLYRLFPLLLVLGFSHEVRAEFSYGPATFSAFGTLGGAWLSNQHADFVQGETQPSGPGRTHDFDLGLDSRLGAQLNVSLAPSTLITAQSVVERLWDNTFQPRLTLANIRQEFGEHIAVRLGRIQSPVFLASNYRLANFSNPWTRTPAVVYGLYPLIHLDALDLTYKFDTDWGTLDLNSGAGWVEQSLPSQAIGHLHDVVYANAKLDNGPWRFKLSWLRANSSSFESPTFNRYLQFVSLLDPAVAKDLKANSVSASIYAIGFSYDDARWLAMGEWGLLRSDDPSSLPERQGGYLTLGYHLDRWLPQITLGYRSSTGRRPHGTNVVSEAIIADVHKNLRTDYLTLNVGLNYTVTDSLILRGQVDFIDPMKNSNGPYTQVDSNYNFKNPGGDILFSLALDFVY